MGNRWNINIILDYIILQNALRRGYFILTVVKFIKYSKEKSAGPFKVILRVFKQKNGFFNIVILYIKSYKNVNTPNIKKLYNYY